MTVNATDSFIAPVVNGHELAKDFIPEGHKQAYIKNTKDESRRQAA